MAPSAIKPEGQAFTRDRMKDHVTPRALQSGEIPAIVEDYRSAAAQARAAGFDGVEVHSADKYLLEQFESPGGRRGPGLGGGASRERAADSSSWCR